MKRRIKSYIIFIVYLTERTSHPAVGFVFYSKTAPPAIWYYPRAVLLFLFDKENENGVSNGVLTKDAFFLITTVSYRSPRKKSITFEQGGVFMPIFPLFY